jgi:hypothetical protein
MAPATPSSASTNEARARDFRYASPSVRTWASGRFGSTAHTLRWISRIRTGVPALAERTRNVTEPKLTVGVLQKRSSKAGK